MDHLRLSRVVAQLLGHGRQWQRLNLAEPDGPCWLCREAKKRRPRNAALAVKFRLGVGLGLLQPKGGTGSHKPGWSWQPFALPSFAGRCCSRLAACLAVSACPLPCTSASKCLLQGPRTQWTAPPIADKGIKRACMAMSESSATAGISSPYRVFKSTNLTLVCKVRVSVAFPIASVASDSA